LFFGSHRPAQSRFPAMPVRIWQVARVRGAVWLSPRRLKKVMAPAPTMNMASATAGVDGSVMAFDGWFRNALPGQVTGFDPKF
jgi:hypothetical protein